MDDSDGDDNVSYLENDGFNIKPRISKGTSSLAAVVPKRKQSKISVVSSVYIKL